MLNNAYTLIIADEANCAVTCGLISVDDLLQLIAEKPCPVELVFTGRGAHPRLIKQADMVSVIQARKHPFNVGVKCRKGIDW